MNIHKDINACLVELSISCYTARKQDKETSKEVREAKGAHSSDAKRKVFT